jgi:hypothetical membrane protein
MGATPPGGLAPRSASGAGTGAGEARALLLAGAMAGPLYIGLGVAQALLREGFDPRIHALSLLANGPMGWVQTLNFVLAGALVAAGAVGVWRVLAGKRGGRWASILLGLYAVGLLGAGLFPADAGAGFPPGTPSPEAMSQAGLLHFVFGALGFYALAGCIAVFAWRYLKGGRSGWAAATAGTALVFLAGFLSMASGPPAPATMLAFYGVVALSWVWLTWALLDLREGRGAEPEGASQGGP